MIQTAQTAKVALLCDLHLPLLENTAPYAALRWAAEQMAYTQVDFCFTLGDITANGDANAAAYFKRAMEMLASSGSSPSWAAVAGNADLRQPEAAPILAPLEPQTALALKDSGWRAVLLDSSSGCLNQLQRDKLQGALASLEADEKLLLLLHHAPENLNRESELWLCDALSCLGSGRLLIAHGHRHRQGRGYWNGIPLLSLQALDPDKAIGSPPGFSVLNLTTAGWSSKEFFWPPDREAIAQVQRHMGISCFDVFEDIDYAIQKGIQLLELRQSHLKNLPREALLQKVADWRRAGGRYLSLHMAELGWTEGALTGWDNWESSIDLANLLQTDAVTLHTPCAALVHMEEHSQVWKQLLLLTAAGLERLPPNCEIHIENMHRNPNDPNDGHRRFGCLPQEIATWIHALQECVSHPERLSFLLDVGHARNNPPYNQKYTMSMWYTIMGKQMGGCHLHQVYETEEGMKNHQAITDFYGPMINFTSFVWSWEKGIINHCPLFLEVRSRQNAELSFKAWESVWKACT